VAEKDYRKELFNIAHIIVEKSDGRASIVFQEEDESSSLVEDAAHFIKVDGKRIGRDIELYGFMGKSIGWQATLAMFLEEILMSIKGVKLEESYNAASEHLRNLGHEIYPENLLEEWDSLF